MQEEPPDLASIVKTLNDAGVRYVLIGGMAMVAHGSAYVTLDVDIAYLRDEENIAALTIAFHALTPQLCCKGGGLPLVIDKDILQTNANFAFDTLYGRVDVLAELSGVSFKELWDCSIVMDIYGYTVHVASIPYLIRMKQATNRLHDQLHVMELQALQRLLEGM